MSAEQYTALMHRAQEHFNRGDLEGYLDLYADDAVLHDFGIEPGRESIRRFYEVFQAAFPDAHITMEDLICEGDRVAERFTVRATHRGPFMDVPATGKSVTVSGMTILRFVGDKCVERWTQADFLGLLQQLGAVPAPEQVEA